MKTSIESIYKNMKPAELARIAFSSIGKQDADTWRACEANVANKTYVGRDLDYTRTLQNHIDFSIMAGLQFHKYAHATDTIMQQWRIDRESMKQADVNLQVIEEYTEKVFSLAMDTSNKFQIVLLLMNSLCDQYNIDKPTCLGFAEINMSVKGLESIEMPDPKLWSDAVKTYHDNIKFVLEATINPDLQGCDHAKN